MPEITPRDNSTSLRATCALRPINVQEFLNLFKFNSMKMKKYTRHPLNWKWTCPISPLSKWVKFSMTETSGLFLQRCPWSFVDPYIMWLLLLSWFKIGNKACIMYSYLNSTRSELGNSAVGFSTKTGNWYSTKTVTVSQRNVADSQWLQFTF